MSDLFVAIYSLLIDYFADKKKTCVRSDVKLLWKISASFVLQSFKISSKIETM